MKIRSTVPSLSRSLSQCKRRWPAQGLLGVLREATCGIPYPRQGNIPPVHHMHHPTKLVCLTCKSQSRSSSFKATAFTMAQQEGPSTPSDSILPLLSELTCSELALDSAGPVWTELLALARQPGMCNLGQGYPDYEGSSVARAGAADAMMKSELVCVHDPYRLPSVV